MVAQLSPTCFGWLPCEGSVNPLEDPKIALQNRPEFVAAKEFADLRLRGHAVPALGSPLVTEFPEDALIALLLDESVSSDYRAGLVAALRDAAIGLIAQLAEIAERSTETQDESKLIRYSRTIDLAGPNELGPLTLALGVVVLSSSLATDSMRQAIVRAESRYFTGELGVGFWVNALQHDSTAAYGLVGLANVDPEHPRVLASLLTLWESRLLRGWTVDAAALTRDLSDLLENRQPNFAQKLHYELRGRLEASGNARSLDRFIQELHGEGLEIVAPRESVTDANRIHRAMGAALAGYKKEHSDSFLPSSNSKSAVEILARQVADELLRLGTKNEPARSEAEYLEERSSSSSLFFRHQSTLVQPN